MKAIIKIHSNPELNTIPDKPVLVVLGEKVENRNVVYPNNNPHLDWEEKRHTYGVALVEGLDFELVMTKGEE